ncbi:MAG: gliding motility-associated C-terminal domain-containing protein [Flavobacteriales bacterium]|nr:gliding motility-associated C-terminal domain-containing protein [Flavobacteriales bacterium]
MRLILFLGLGLAAIPRVLAHDHASGHEPHRGLEFHENKGQWPHQVLYRARTTGGAVFVEPSAFTYVLQSGGPEHASRPDAVHAPFREHAYRMRFIGGEAKGHSGLERLPHYVNYFLGDDPAKWAGRVGAFGGVTLQAVYPGIDLRLDGHEGFKYDWLVAPGADPASIVLEFEGQDAMWVKDGLLYIRTTAGEVIEQRPVAWTERDGVRSPVRCEYQLEGKRLGYALPEGYDAGAPLVIDPVVVFSSYSGSFGDNFGFTATYDATGHLYGGGMVRTSGYPVTLGVVQSVYGGGENDIAVSKFTPAGNNLVWSTYIGGSSNEVPHSMVVNSDDELYILGTSNSANFPTTAGCWDNSFNGGTNPPFAVTSYGFTYTNGCDMVVVHLSSDATALVGSTWVGGSGNDGLNQVAPTNRNYGDPFRGEIILDLEELPVVVSSTSSTDMFTTPTAVQTTLAGGGLDAYVFRMDEGLATILWATYYGGSGVDAGFGVQTSSIGEIYITGGTTSTNLPSAGSPAFATNQGGTDGFIARFHPTGAPLLSTTYVGASGFDQSYFVQLNTIDEVFVVGQTSGPYPITPGKYNNPNATQFLHKFSGDLATSQWSTRIGGSGNENISPSAFLVSNCGQIYFSGWAGSTNSFGVAGLTSSTVGLPVTPDAFQSTTNGSDFYLMLLELEAVSLGYATFFGGTSAEHVDGGTSRFDKNGIVYQAVCAGCQLLSYPTTPGVWSSTNNSDNCNLGVFKIDFEQNVQVTIDANINSAVLCLEDPVVLTAVGTADEWLWDLGDGSPTSTDVTLAHIYAEPGVYTITLIGTALGLCVAVDTATVEITVVAPAVLQPAFSAVPTGTCDAVSVELFNSSTGGNQFIWSFGDGTNSTATNPVHPYVGPGQYTITLGVIDPICVDTVFVSQTVEVGIPGLTFTLDSPVGLCDGGSALLNAGPGFDTYQWSTGEQSMMITVEESGAYSVVVTDGFCTGTDTVIVTPPVSYPALLDQDLCPGETAVLAAPFVPQAVLWSTGVQTSNLSVTVAGTYWYTATDPLGCTVSDTAEVRFVTLATGNAVIPNVFSPNGDGINDIFLPENIDAADFRMDIYSRWGTKVFSSASSGKGWNGKLENEGETVPDGTYFVVLTYREYCKSGSGITHTGHVTLLR